MIRYFILHGLLIFSSMHLLADASSFTRGRNLDALKQLPFDNRDDFEEATKGFIAALPNDGLIKNNQGEIVWNLPAYGFVSEKREEIPDTANPSLWRQLKLLQKSGLFRVVDGIYQVRSADLSNMTVIEGKTGLIIIDPLLSKETAKAAIDLYYANRPKKEIKAVIYTHSHADHFGGVKGVISQADVDAKKVEVIAPYGFTEAALNENIMAGNAMTRRAMYMYGSLLKPGPEGQLSAGLGLTTSSGETTLILPTYLVTKTGEEMTIDGVKFVFLMAPGSEAPAEMLFFLPEFKALAAAEDATHTMHNLYTLRGAKVRDARAWASYLNQAIEMFGAQTEVVFAQHHWPKWGNERVIDFIEKQRDMYKYIHDQSLRLANQGFNMVEIGEMIQMPDSLAKEWYNRGYYGSLNHNAKSVYNFYLGWFSGNPSTLHPLPIVEASKKEVEYMGGADAILEKSKKDFDKGNYRWVAQVLNYLVYAEPHNKQAKNLLADTLEQLGYQAENGTWRNFYLSGAKELREGVNLMATANTLSPDMISSMPIENFFDYLSIKLNGLKAAENPMSINFELPDQDKKYFIQIKNGVLHYFSNKNQDAADLSITINRKDLDSLIIGKTTIDGLTKAGKLSIKGEKGNFQRFLSLFDKFNPWFNLVEPIN
ncbi:alkyl sulfatase dimerization domain-containing protein [Parachlamydia sp. AcF125]|uniref:alkyl/aryl-sulfatase n=1 Tax=Parachlamydia sp. AcF125 TaxID=2795736 RepID=UPI001BC8E525|nr:alkyl sulfatase dimerization domain-containing protein [Parachlamydia sp. AcF125]MBS4168132.1 putative alkyl/aryl-sulfatase YjcS [Parachlamydia sp. AcF125]